MKIEFFENEIRHILVEYTKSLLYFTPENYNWSADMIGYSVIVTITKKEEQDIEPPANV